MAKGIDIVGEKFRQLWERKMSQEAFAANVGMKRTNVQRLSRPGVHGVHVDAFGNIARWLGISTDELEKRIGLPHNGIPTGISQTADTAIIPEWGFDVRASHWAHVPICELSPDDPVQAAVLRTGRFRLRIEGDCMEPTYKSGSLIEFQIMKHDEQLPLFADYVVCTSQNCATFKKLMALMEDTMLLAAINQKKYPGAMFVPRQEIVRIAKVFGIVAPPPEPAEIKILKPKVRK